MSNMYISIYFVFIAFLLIKTIETKSSNHDDGSRLKQWWIEKGYQKSTTTVVNNQSQISPLFELCIPFHSCPTKLNRTILIIVIPILILTFCCYFHCYEYCKVRRQLANEQLKKSQHYCYTNIYVQNIGFAV